FLAECMAFVHTSRYEGQPQAVMEALAAGTPALLTPGTNMQKFIIENNMGWVCGHSTKDIADGLIRISQCKQEEFEKLSQNAAIYAYKNFRWDVIARSFGESLRSYSCHKV